MIPINEMPAIACMNPLIVEAYSVLEARPLSKTLAHQLAALQGADILDLISLAHKVKSKFSPQEHVCTIMNAKSGACPEDCRFCAQSGFYQTTIETFGLVSQEKIIQEARLAFENGASNFALVTSGTGYMKSNQEFENIIESILSLHQHLPDLNVCASLGMLSRENVQALAKAGIKHYNINLQVNPKKYRKLIATTHSIETKLQTIEWLQQAGIKTCVGGILGLGETMEDRVDLAYALKEIDVDVIPLNVLLPISGTPLENQPELSVAEIAKTFALFRLIHPMKTIKFAAGRETKMKDFQGLLMLAGANGLLTGGYLTTRGRETGDDFKLLDHLKSFE